MCVITKNKIRDFEKHLVCEEKTSSTVKKYVYDITAFAEWVGADKVDKNTVLQYKEKLISEYKPRSVNSIISSLNSYFEFVGHRECKVRTLKIQRQIFADNELTKEEYKRLLKAAKDSKNERMYYLMQTICSTGIRVSELRFITVDAVLKQKACVRLKGKLRTVLLPKNLCKALMLYIRKNKIEKGAVFVTRSGKNLDRSNIWTYMKKLCRLADVPKDKVFPHNLRHLFARTYYLIQKDIVRLADILGHSSINTTRIYTMETGDIHRKQIQKLGLLQC